MATAEHRSDVSAVQPPPAAAAAARQPRLSWLGFVGFGLIVLLLAVALVQARQFALLRQVVQTGDDYDVLSIFQAETEYLRLREQWRTAADEHQPLDADALKLRYEIWVSRVDLLHADKPNRVIRGDAEYVQTIQQADAFIASADRVFGNAGSASEAPLTRSFVQSMLPALDALGRPMHGMSLTAAHNVAEQMEQRATAVRQQNQLGLFLTVFLSVLTLAFAALALRQMRQLRERRVVLEELANNLRQARREAESASEAKSAFLANMSHEIRTPFHGLMGMLSLLRETGLNPRQIDYLRTATESADHLLAILNDILDMSQLESGRMKLSPTAVELRALLRDVEALMRPQAAGKQLTLHIDADPGVPGRVLLDTTRVKQVLFNLLSNAIKFSDHGTVVLDVRSKPLRGGSTGSHGNNGTQHDLEFIVNDTGIGMDEATLAQLFNRFVQGDNTSRRRHGGTGLGLEISRNLARLMGGDITARSKPGSGSSFIFRFPVQVLREAGMPQRPAAPPGLAGLPAARALRVLVAEDHPVNRQYLSALLDNLGHSAHFTANGQEAVAALQAQSAPGGGARFDVVLMDLHMPLLDGAGATRAIRMLPDAALNTVPIVALTADAFAETRERCLVAGMNDFLTKPVSPQKLATSLRRLFGSDAVGRADGRSAADVPLPGWAGSQRPPGLLNPPGALNATPAPLQQPAHTRAQVDQASYPVHANQAALVDEGAIALSLESMSAARLGRMLEDFLDQGSVTVQRLRAAVREAQPLELRVNAHAAKGAALNLGLSALAHTAEALQEGASHLPAHEIARLVQRYEQQLVQTRRAVQALGLVDDRGTGQPQGLGSAVDTGAVGGGRAPPATPFPSPFKR